jgi:dehydrogenase/reductase SDR family member 4
MNYFQKCFISFPHQLWENDEDQKGIEAIGTLLGRLGNPDECAGTVAFLCSEDASYITGDTIVIAGGAFSRL